jgi:arylsulfatase A-like enzyme
MSDPAKNPEIPNVVLICCDHLRADWCGCNGHPVVMTPQIDELAYEGLNFTAAFSECPVCVPARRIMMTGMGPYGVHMNVNVDPQPFPEGPKLAEVMTAAGYQTFASGKLHTCPQRNRIGFEEVQLNEEGRKQGGLLKDDYEAYLDDHGYGHLAYTHGLGNNEYGLRLSPLPERFTTTHWTAQKAMEFIDRRDPTRPFFLHLSFDKPHPPIVPPESYYALYRDAEMPAPARGDWVEAKTPTQVEALRLKNNYYDWQDHPLMIQQSLRGFAAMITHIDSMIGVFLGHLREHGLLDNTLVLLVSDHGDQLFDHGNLAKGEFFRGSTNIPFIVRPPRGWAKAHGFRYGRVNRTAPVGLQDVMPTILDVCGVALPDSIEGQSLVPLLLDDDAPFREYSCGNCGSVYGLSDGHYKYVWFSGDDIEFLFDQRNDPHECHDLSADPAWGETLALWRGRLAQWLAENNDPHVEDGALKAIPVAWDLETARASNGWNNRGRH